MSRLVIVGGPRCGKSFAALRLSRGEWAFADGSSMPRDTPVYCGDPLSTVKDPEPTTTYLPEGLGFGSAASQWIVDNWLTMPGPWVLEGHVMARVLRKWMTKDDEPGSYGYPAFPCDRVIVFKNQRADQELKRGQMVLHRTVMDQWSQIDLYYEPITEER